jgi:hypothetical protein
VPCTISIKSDNEGDAETKEIMMTKMKKQALLVALASALALGAVTTSFAQEATQNGFSQQSHQGSSYNMYDGNQGNPWAGNSGGSDY